ncbi:MAG: RidA family protein [Rhodospirillales bacterium]|nr:RidA family protein [Rhodospirillales bacterium]
MTTTLINPATLYDGAPIGMSQAKIDTDSGLVFISGQVAWDANHATKSPDIVDQTRCAIENLKIVLEASNASVESILHLRIYVRGEVADHMEKIAPLMAEYFGTSRPAVTGIGVASLASPDLLIEIEATAKVTT